MRLTTLRRTIQDHACNPGRPYTFIRPWIPCFGVIIPRGIEGVRCRQGGRGAVAVTDDDRVEEGCATPRPCWTATPTKSSWSLDSFLAVSLMLSARSFSRSSFSWNSPTALRHRTNSLWSRLFSLCSS